MNHKPDQNANYAFTASHLSCISARLSATKGSGMYRHPSTGSEFAFQFFHQNPLMEVFRSFTAIKVNAKCEGLKILPCKKKKLKQYTFCRRV